MDYKEKLRLAKEALDSGKDIIAWLEKQGEKTIPENIDDAALQYVDTCAVDGEITHGNVTEPYWNNHSMMNAYKAGWLEKQGEQEQVPITDEWIEDYWKHHKVTNPNSYDKGDEVQFDHDGFVRFCNKYFQKPTWSEEDENMLQKALSIIRYALSIPADKEDDPCFAGSSTIAWLKSLKERMKGE